MDEKNASGETQREERLRESALDNFESRNPIQTRNNRESGLAEA